MLWSLPGGLLRPREIVRQLYLFLIGSAPLAVTAGLALGAVIWLHLHRALIQVGGPGAVRYLPQALALTVIMEFGPLAAGLIVAGRSGSRLAAELASMRLTEQLDALETLGQSSVRVLVVPRVWAAMLSLPLLTVIIDYLALGAGYGAEALGGNMSWALFSRECLQVLSVGRVLPAVLKTLTFGFAIGVSGCYVGMASQGGAESVGHSATAGVATSIFLVLLLDVCLVRATQGLF